MRAGKYVLALAMAAGVWMSFWAPDAKGFVNSRLARIIFFHLPCAISTTIFLFVGAWYGLGYLRTRNWSYEIKSAAANEMGFTLGVLTMITGVLFSEMQWGEWWQWDPRQTSFLLVLFLFAGYFALRAGFSEGRRRAANSAAYSVAMLLPAIFLIFVFPRLPYVQRISFHPSQTIVQGGFDRIYSSVLWPICGLILIVAVWLFRMRVRAFELEHLLEESNEGLDDRGRPTDSGVVGPVHISDED